MHSFHGILLYGVRAMSRKIKVTDNGISIGKKSFNWDEILGIRKFTSIMFKQMSTRGPYFELMIRGGKAIRIYAINEIEGIGSKGEINSYTDDNNKFYALLELIEKKAINLKEEVSNWREWRLILPIISIQIIVLLVGLIMRFDIEQLGFSVIAGGFIGAAFGFYWERKARFKIWK